MLADTKKTNFAEIEREVGISNGQIRRWDTSSPKIENIQKVADYFNVSVDYLLGRTDNPSIKNSDEYSDLVMMFRKNENEIPEERRDLYRTQVKSLMEHIRETMEESDKRNKPK